MLFNLCYNTFVLQQCKIKGSDKMLCENDYCIYCDNGECILTEIALDYQGRCTECIMVDIESSILKKQKQKQLKKLDCN